MTVMNAYLDLHPTSHVVSGKVCTHNIQHVYREWTEGDRFFVLVMPSTSQLSSLIPNFLDLWIVLDNNGIFKVRSRSRLYSVSVQAIFAISLGSTGVDAYVKIGRGVSQSSGKMDTVDIVVVALRYT